jgi:hypothetical protein
MSNQHNNQDDTKQCDDNNIQNIIIMLVTLVISEILPFIKNIKANGILELIYNIIYKLLNNSIYRLSDERQPLLRPINSNNNQSVTTDINTENTGTDMNIGSEVGISGDASTVHIDSDGINDILERKMNDLNTNLDINLKNISNVMISYVTELQNTRQLKLHPAELYELNYFINYIKINYPKKIYHTRFLSKTNKQLLISQGYIIDYDMQNDTHVIKW